MGFETSPLQQRPDSNTPVQYSTTPVLHYSSTPLLQYSITPVLHYSTTSITPSLQFFLPRSIGELCRARNV
jgi:hypothetical protein